MARKTIGRSGYRKRDGSIKNVKTYKRKHYLVYDHNFLKHQARNRKLTVNRQLATQTAAHEPTQYRMTARSFSEKNIELQGAPQSFTVCNKESYLFLELKRKWS